MKSRKGEILTLVTISNSPAPEGAGMIQIGILLCGWDYTPLLSPSRRAGERLWPIKIFHNVVYPNLEFSTRLALPFGPWLECHVVYLSDKTPTPSDQLQPYEDSVPGNLEFKRLKEHFEPFIRASSASASASHHLRTTQHIHSRSMTACFRYSLSGCSPSQQV